MLIAGEEICMASQSLGYDAQWHGTVENAEPL